MPPRRPGPAGPTSRCRTVGWRPGRTAAARPRAGDWRTLPCHTDNGEQEQTTSDASKRDARKSRTNKIFGTATQVKPPRFFWQRWHATLTIVGVVRDQPAEAA